MAKRIEYVDIAKAFGILLVLGGHTGLPAVMRAWIYSFHMPLFFLISGMWFREKPMAVSVRKTFHSCLVPYLVYSTVFTVVNLAVYRDMEVLRSNLTDTFILGRGSCNVLWFLLSLFFVETFISYSPKQQENRFGQLHC